MPESVQKTPRPETQHDRETENCQPLLTGARGLGLDEAVSCALPWSSHFPWNEYYVCMHVHVWAHVHVCVQTESRVTEGGGSRDLAGVRCGVVGHMKCVSSTWLTKFVGGVVFRNWIVLI